MGRHRLQSIVVSVSIQRNSNCRNWIKKKKKDFFSHKLEKKNGYVLKVETLFTCCLDHGPMNLSNFYETMKIMRLCNFQFLCNSFSNSLFS